MELRENESGQHEPSTAPHNENAKPSGYRVEDDNNLDEKDLKTRYLFGESEMKNGSAPGMEGEGVGGESFGENNTTPSGDARPSENVGYSNSYMNRTQPMEEHPENNNFKDISQQGAPNYNQGGQRDAQHNEPVKEECESTLRPNATNSYQEGTADNDGTSQYNFRYKEGHAESGWDDEKDHIET